MILPPLFSQANIHAPMWVPVNLTGEQQKDLRRHLALIVGYNTNTGLIEGLGSGFVVSGVPEIFVVTASHVLMGFVNQHLGARAKDIFGSDEENFYLEGKRLFEVLKDAKIRVVVECLDKPGVQVLEIQSIWLGHEKRCDLAMLRCVGAEAFSGETMVPALPDFKPADQLESLFMAGFVKMGAIPIDEEARIATMRRYICVRASRVAEDTRTPEGAHPGSWQWRVTMPSEHGMSGGPLLRLRLPKGEPIFVNDVTPQIRTSVGVISRGRAGGMFAGFEEKAGETWITPIEAIRHLAGETTLGIIDYQDIEEKMRKSNVREGVGRFDLIELFTEKRDRLKKDWERNHPNEQARAEGAFTFPSGLQT
jgi:hypothetical protein